MACGSKGQWFAGQYEWQLNPVQDSIRRIKFFRFPAGQIYFLRASLGLRACLSIHIYT
jgi:hypothetical protein